MKFRLALHAEDLNAIRDFYIHVIGLSELGGFQNHGTYSGVFLGKKEENWHLEFTTSTDLPNRKLDEDDALVFYPKTAEEFNKIKQNISVDKRINAKNDYWNRNGISTFDPERNFIVIVNPEAKMR